MQGVEPKLSPCHSKNLVKIRYKVLLKLSLQGPSNSQYGFRANVRRGKVLRGTWIRAVVRFPLQGLHQYIDKLYFQFFFASF